MIEYQYASKKGATKIGDKISSPFGFGDVDVNFTGANVVETATVAGKTVWGKDATQIGCWDDVTDPANPVFVKGSVIKTATNGTRTVVPYANIAVGDNINYIYDNIVIPQADLPTVKAEMKSIALVAKARRIAIYYSQIAAYQAKTDYGVDLGDQLAEKAVGELSYKTIVPLAA